MITDFLDAYKNVSDEIVIKIFLETSSKIEGTVYYFIHDGLSYETAHVLSARGLGTWGGLKHEGCFRLKMVIEKFLVKTLEGYSDDYRRVFTRLKSALKFANEISHISCRPQFYCKHVQIEVFFVEE